MDSITLIHIHLKLTTPIQSLKQIRCSVLTSFIRNSASFFWLLQCATSNTPFRNADFSLKTHLTLMVFFSFGSSVNFQVLFLSEASSFSFMAFNHTFFLRTSPIPICSESPSDSGTVSPSGLSSEVLLPPKVPPLLTSGPYPEPSPLKV